MRKPQSTGGSDDSDRRRQHISANAFITGVTPDAVGGVIVNHPLAEYMTHGKYF